MITVALYARVSSERQVQENTIASQIDALAERIVADGFKLLEEYKFIDSGYSGSNLDRPALEKLRDQIAAGTIDKVYIHSPDRLSRKYAYQMILLEEFEKFGVEVIFLNFQQSNNPESHLLLQMQGMIAEYERSKITERHRRGRIHAAKRGSVNVLSSAAYGYRYIDKHTGGGQATLEIIEEEAEIVRKIFNWVGKERLTLGGVILRLAENKVMTRKNKTYWDRATIWYMLKNPVYKGQAAFGKKKIGARLPSIRPRKDSIAQPKQNYSRNIVDKKDWIFIETPAIIDETLFEVVQEQLEENRKKARMHQKGATYLLQGLLMCKDCGRAFCGGKSIRRNVNSSNIYLYYRCIGTDSYRYGGNKLCTSSQISGYAVETVIWEEVKKLLKNPRRLFNEYQRRLSELEKSPIDDAYTVLDKRRKKLENGISLLIDSYAQQYIIKEEFEPRIKVMRQNLQVIKEQQNKLNEQKNLTKELHLIITSLENFASGVDSKLENLDWHDKRDVIRAIVKRIEISQENINIVYKISKLPDYDSDNPTMPQHCCNSTCGTTASGSSIILHYHSHLCSE